MGETSDYGFDVFVSYASEDRATVKSLVEAMEARDLRVWWDKGQITLGDRLSAKIDEGLQNSRYGVVIISLSFVVKNWPTAELRSMINRSTSSGTKVILPILLGLDHHQFAERYPLMADTVTAQVDGNLDIVVDQISDAVGKIHADFPYVVASHNGDQTGETSETHSPRRHGAIESSFLNDGELLARLIPYGRVEDSSEVVWTNKPQVFLRLVPTQATETRTSRQIHGLISSGGHSIPLLGRVSGLWFERNEFGAVAFDASEIGQTTASSFVQIFEDGEIWAIDSTLLNNDRNGIPSIAIETNLEAALAAYLAFAKSRLNLALPLHLVAGVDQVKGFSIFVDHGMAGNIVKPSIVHKGLIEDYDVVPHKILLPLFRKIWDEAGFDRPDNLRTLD